MNKANCTWIEYALITDTDCATPGIEEYLGQSLSRIIHDILYDDITPNKYPRVYNAYKNNDVSKTELMRVRHNAWRIHKRKMAKNNQRIARVKQTETEL